MEIKTCPTCGSRRIKQVTQDVACDFAGQSYTARDITFYPGKFMIHRGDAENAEENKEEK
jgi:hypothetical protein